jgi:hypothetical protein
MYRSESGMSLGHTPQPSPSCSRSVVLVSWDGKSEPLATLHLDAQPEFEWLLFDYSGRRGSSQQVLRGQSMRVLSVATECKGEIYLAFAEHLDAEGITPEYVALIDDDVLLSVSGINRALFLGRGLGLDVFSPVLTHDSCFTFAWTLQQAGNLMREVDWVEVMMPFYRGALFLAGREHYRGNISSWGIDAYLIPVLQRLLDMPRTALLDSVPASHRRPVTSGNKVYRNGRTAMEERSAMKELSLQIVREQKPALEGSDWWQEIVSEHRFDLGRRSQRPRRKGLQHRARRFLQRWLREED